LFEDFQLGPVDSFGPRKTSSRLLPRTIRSYKRALQIASVGERSIAPDHDTWLMMALKQSVN